MARSSSSTTPQYGTFDDWLEQQPQQERGKLCRLRDELVRLFGNPRRSDIRWWRAVGTCVVKLFPAADKRRGQGFMEVLGDVAQPRRDRSQKSIITFLYWARELAQKLSREEVADLGKKVRAQQITMTHVINLLSIDDTNNTQSRAQFLRACLREKWSANRLKREIQGDRRHLTSFGGRRSTVRTSTNPAVAAREMIVRSESWAACCRQYFLVKGAPLAKRRQRCSPRLARELVRALQEVTELADLARKARGILRQIVGELPEDEGAYRPGKDSSKKGSAARRTVPRQIGKGNRV